jgi:hypothetical protein
MGILGIVTHIEQIQKEFNITNGDMTIGCDSLGAIKTLQSTAPIIKSSWKHFDIIKSIRTTIDNSPISITFRHILGHQDDVHEFHELDRWAQLNVLVDSTAKRKITTDMTRVTQQRALPFHLPYETCAIYWRDRRTRPSKLCSKLKSNLTKMIHTLTIWKYWMKGRKFSGYTESYIDWEITKRSRRNISKSRQRWMSKWLSGFCGVGIMLVKYAFQKHSKCPRCGNDNESTTP